MKPKRMTKGKRRLLAEKHYLLACKLDFVTVEKWQYLQKRSIERIDNLIKELI